MPKRYGYPLTLVALTALLVGFAFHADAGFMIFQNRDSWQSAQTGIDDQLNFNGFRIDTSFANVAINFGAFSLRTIGTPPEGSNKIDVPPFDDVITIQSVDGTPYATMFLDSTRSVALDFNTPVTAFGADFAGVLCNFDVFLLNRRVPESIGPEAGQSFFGFTSTDAFDRIEFRHNGPPGSDSNVQFDNASFVSAAAPEPSSLLLLGAGATLLISYSCWRLRRGKL